MHEVQPTASAGASCRLFYKDKQLHVTKTQNNATPNKAGRTRDKQTTIFYDTIERTRRRETVMSSHGLEPTQVPHPAPHRRRRKMPHPLDQFPTFDYSTTRRIHE